MKCQIGDRVVDGNDVRIGGTVVSLDTKWNPHLGCGTGYYEDMAWVLFDNEIKVIRCYQYFLYPESITLTANRKPELVQRIEYLEKLAKGCSTTNNGWKQCKK